MGNSGSRSILPPDYYYCPTLKPVHIYGWLQEAPISKEWLQRNGFQDVGLYASEVARSTAVGLAYGVPCLFDGERVIHPGRNLKELVEDLYYAAAERQENSTGCTPLGYYAVLEGDFRILRQSYCPKPAPAPVLAPAPAPALAELP